MLSTVLLALSAASAVQSMDIRFCPGEAVRTYPLDSLRGVQGLLLQNVAIVNRGKSPLKLESVAIELRDADRVLDTRRLDAKALQAAVAGGQAVQQQGVIAAYPFQFCDGALLKDATLAKGDTLAPGEAVLVMQQVFAFKGARTQLAIQVQAAGQSAEGRIPVVSGTSKTDFSWPLRGRPAWTIGSGASFHTTHRWAVPEEFALDIVSVGEDGRSFRTNGSANSDFRAYGADVLAAADGTVVRLITGAKEEPPLLRKKDETMETYYGRIGARQLANISLGQPGVLGDAIVLDHGNSEFSVYAHLKLNSMTVKLGDKVKRNQKIAELGSSGNSTEPHLHFHICDRVDGLACAGIPPRFSNVVLPLADGDRPLQSGDVVTVAD